MCGDWNVVQNYALDTMNYYRQNNPKSQQAIFGLIDGFELFDIFRMQNPKNQRFTWHSLRKGVLKQARLEYFLVSSDITDLVQSIETFNRLPNRPFSRHNKSSFIATTTRKRLLEI